MSQYSGMTVKELQSKCKELGLQVYKGKSSLKKQELIDELEAKEEDASKRFTKALKEMSEEISEDNKQQAKMEYVERAEIGALVAFKLPDGKVKSAKVINRSSSKRKLKLETQYGAQFIISYEDVLWVRTGPRWPHGVYLLLKGKVNANEDQTRY